MTKDEIAAVLSEITYKTGWVLSWEWVNEGRESELLHVRWTAEFPDSRDPEGTVREFFHGTALHPLRYQTEEDLVQAVWGLTRRAELHEAGEFYRFRGELVRDPHKGEL